MGDVDPRGPPLFLADDTALDFLNSRATPGGHDVEWIADGADLIVWLETAGRLATGEASRLRSWPAATIDRSAQEARELREWFRGVVDAASGDAGSGRPRAVVTDRMATTLNEILYPDALSWRIDPEREPPLRLERRVSTPAGLLLPIAESMARLLCEGDFRRVRRCEGTGCTLHFLDTSKNGGRRWCSMAGCGNRAKAAQHRARRRTG